ncbi:glycosyltransferase family 4 protein [Akkermansiaceae bacterium]|nr:glycosyltransferase family 4 protein [Akkermansiaceae bacterium]
MGGSTRSYEIARGLVKLGYRVTIVTSLRDEQRCLLTSIENIEGVCIHWIKVPYSNKMNFVRRLVSFVQFALKSAILGRKIESDIVYASSTPLTVILPALFCSKVKKIPMIFEVRDLWPNIPIAMGVLKNRLLIYVAELLEMIAYNQASHIIALSPDMESFIIRKGIDTAKVTTIPNASDISLFNMESKKSYNFRRELGIDEEAVVILYAGTFGNVNGCSYIIELASKLRNLNIVKFVLIGEGKEKRSIISRAKSLEVLGDNVFVLPQMSKNRMPYYFQKSDLIISTIINITELEANSANKVFDGFAAGRGVLINHGGWISDVLKSSNAGIQLSRKPDEAAVQLTDLVNDRGLLEEMGENARKLAKTTFNREKLTRKIGKIIASTLSPVTKSS